MIEDEAGRALAMELEPDETMAILKMIRRSDRGQFADGRKAGSSLSLRYLRGRL